MPESSRSGGSRKALCRSSQTQSVESPIPEAQQNSGKENLLCHSGFPTGSGSRSRDTSARSRSRTDPHDSPRTFRSEKPRSGRLRGQEGGLSMQPHPPIPSLPPARRAETEPRKRFLPQRRRMPHPPPGQSFRKVFRKSSPSHAEPEEPLPGRSPFSRNHQFRSRSVSAGRSAVPGRLSNSEPWSPVSRESPRSTAHRPSLRRSLWKLPPLSAPGCPSPKKQSPAGSGPAFSTPVSFSRKESPRSVQSRS